MGERLILDRTYQFNKSLKHIKDKGLKIKIWKQIKKITENPTIGKPMRNVRKGTREVYVSPFRLSYSYLEKENKIVILDLYHKDEQ
ncbi:type II toxin-antitoxin system RelE/ParE family toxin [Candidatus Woesearchaeota archaeon]|nr:type II toxin-antitoxin system RelE/ParE family toxin [Candidatus Woesearchaeota archaeon]